jgi:hypothetical protein
MRHLECALRYVVGFVQGPNVGKEDEEVEIELSKVWGGGQGGMRHVDCAESFCGCVVCIVLCAVGCVVCQALCCVMYCVSPFTTPFKPTCEAPPCHRLTQP